jgi:hypothetical protein
MAKGVKTGGRKAGVPNKVTKDIKSMVEGALIDAGGQSYLASQALESPAAFLALIGRLLPKDVKVSGEIKHSLEELILHSVQSTTPSRR